MPALFENPNDVKIQIDLTPPTMSAESGLTEQDVNLTVHSTLGELPGYAVVLDSHTTGEDLGRLLADQAELPGVILLEQGILIGVISQSHYYKCVSRAFGREIYQGRSAALMLEDVKDRPLILSAGCGIQSAVEECLSRPTYLVYEPFVVYHETSSEYRLCSFQSLLLASSKIAALRNGQMAQILNSITDGLLVIDRTFQIGNEYSQAAAHIFERTDLDRFTFLEVLEPLIDPVLHGQIADYLAILFNPKLIDKLIRTINPAKQITVHFPLPEEHIKHLAFSFERVRSQGEITQVLVRVEDITLRLNLARELERQEEAAEEKLQLILQILRVEPTVLKEFIRRFREAINSLGELLKTKGIDDLHKKINEVFRTVHTLKGESALLRLNFYERPLNRLEDGLESLRENSELNDSHLTSIGPAVDVLKVLDGNVSLALAHLEQLSPRQTAANSGIPSAEPLGPLALVARLIKDLSERLAKPVTFHTQVRDEDLPAEYRGIIHELLLHLARNSMVHGIESAPVRESGQKAVNGTIQFAIKPHPDFHEIIFQDDGAGLNYEKIRLRALQLGQTLSSREDYHDAIFTSGFSTAESVSDLAGRGVGLDAIRNSVLQSGGNIRVYSEEGIYCAFQVLLPKAISKAGRAT